MITVCHPDDPHHKKLPEEKNQSTLRLNHMHILLKEGIISIK